MSRQSSERVTDQTSLTATDLGASLTVASVSRSRDWYREVLGFTLDREFEREGNLFAASMRAGAARVLLTQDNGAKGENRTKGEGFSLQFTTQGNVDAIADRAKAAGATLDTEPSDVWGQRVFRLRDPDGFRLVISSQREGDR
ncbi:MAG TPA: VOC family protein [Gemmatimonadaceae bacterium]|jgi:uncharacterized glyoxalase superfamily protein PhnB|nr:VOC family protein [Gemmatimonadaceae bacterium]